MVKVYSEMTNEEKEEEIESLLDEGGYLDDAEESLYLLYKDLENDEVWLEEQLHHKREIAIINVLLDYPTLKTDKNKC